MSLFSWSKKKEEPKPQGESRAIVPRKPGAVKPASAAAGARAQTAVTRPVAAQAPRPVGVIQTNAADSIDARPARREVPVITTQDDLAKMTPSFKRVIHKAFDLATVASRICPVELINDEVTLFCVADHLHSDQADEVERMVKAKRYKLSETPRVVIATPTLLIALVREQITQETLRNRRNILQSKEKSSMWAAFHDIVAWGVNNDASDIHINVQTEKSDSQVRFTVNGKYIVPERFSRMASSTLLEILAVAWMDIDGGNGTVFDPMTEQQGSLHHEVDGRPIMLRWASLATDAGPSVTMRILRLDGQTTAGSFESLGYLQSQIDMMDRARLAEGGAVVLAGVVGSGKSTTIATMMSMIPETRKVITLEDPVEYIIPRALQNTITRSLDSSSNNSFDAKLKTVKRSAMTDLLIGEIRDVETGRAFMDLAGSGTNLYTTTHTGSVTLIPDRLASDFVGVSRDFLATPGVLKLLVYQALLPKLCQHCALPFSHLYEEGGTTYEGKKKDGDYWRGYAERISRLYDFDPAVLKARNPEGCVHCRRSNLPQLVGIDGRTVIAEMVEPGVDEEFLQYVRRSDNVALRRHFLSQRETPYTDPNMNGKTGMECAAYKAYIGLLDPREIEPRFRSFETEELARRKTGVSKA